MKKIKEFFKKNKLVFLSLGIIAVLLNIAFFSSTDSLLLIILCIYWLIIGFIYKLNEKYFLGLALVFLIPTSIFLILGNFPLSEKFSVWEFLFIVIALTRWIISEVINR